MREGHAVRFVTRALMLVTEENTIYPRNSDEWSTRILASVAEHHVKLATSPVIDMNGRLLHM